MAPHQGPKRKSNQRRASQAWAIARGRRTSILLRCQPVLNIQDFFHHGQHGRDETRHRPTEHEHVFAEVFGHEGIPLLCRLPF